MAEVFRVYKEQGNFTIMSNHHLQNPNLSLKAMGLLSRLLSLPDNWDISIRGMAKIGKDGQESIRTAFKELIKEGYVIRKQMRDVDGKMSGVEYIVRETPDVIIPKDFLEVKSVDEDNESEDDEENNELPEQEEPDAVEPNTVNPDAANPDTVNPDAANPDAVNPDTVNPDTVNPKPDNPKPDNRSQISTKEKNTKIQITTPPTTQSKSRVEAEACIKARIDYAALIAENDKILVDQVVQLLVRYETGLGKYAYVDGQKVSAVDIKAQFEKVYLEDVGQVLFSATNTEVKNLNSYLISALYKTVLKSNTTDKITARPNCARNKKNQFNNFPQRDYSDFSEFERQLMMADMSKEQLMMYEKTEKEHAV